MKLADWQKNQITMPIHEIVIGNSNDYNKVWDAIEKACSGGMKTNGPDRFAVELRKEIEFAALSCGLTMTTEQASCISRMARKLVSDRFEI